MRTLLVAAAALVAVSATTPALAAPPILPAPSMADIALSAPLFAPATGGTAVQKKKKESATLQTVKGAKRGKKGLKIKIKVAKSDRTCEMNLQWADGSSADVEDVDASTGKVCTFTVDVPKGRDVVGDAEVSVKVKDGTGKKVASVSGSFTVK